MVRSGRLHPWLSQSALSPAGRGAEEIAELFWWMTGAAAVIWLVVAALAVWAVLGGPAKARPAAQRAMIIWGGAVVPTVVLGGLLAYGLSLLPGLLAAAPPGTLKVSVVGEQWWWRVRYHPAQGVPFETANEIRLPVGEPVELELRSADVIHSFWIPSLGGKMDMFPGRPTRLVLEPTKTGRFRGVCAEYCGASHALMAFDVLVLEKPEFELWLEKQRRLPPEASGIAAEGRDLFLANGCASCHAIRGTAADGVIGPDLTYVGGRLSLAAGTLPAGAESLRRWIARTHEVKPGALMPHFAMLPREELDALAAYLESLK